MSKISEEECIQLIIDMLDGANNNELALKYKADYLIRNSD